VAGSEAADRIVRVEGNTAVAVSSPEALRLYPISWHLGAARAANVVQYLQEKCGMDPLQLVATSLGELRPRADNSTEAGKSQNRRVDCPRRQGPLRNRPAKGYYSVISRGDGWRWRSSEL
jgi:flagellar motor protein MotB